MENDLNRGIERSRLNIITDKGLSKGSKRNTLKSITEISLNKGIKAEHTKQYHRNWPEKGN